MRILNSLEDIDMFIKDNSVTILYFSSLKCGVCTTVLLKIKEIINEYSNLKIGKIEIDEVKEAIGRFNVFTIPCILVFFQEKEIIRQARFINIKEFKEKLNRFYKLIVSNGGIKYES
ncbi:thioredoxin family protein [Clostridium rectalis]|uniref:thioredoxin family protein n=1 Tax=Clostridium rectalis TaxID=2040295 RepID=UPI000F63E0F9|nr:thioredoxin family protein [Clostridium rectalis]